MIPYVEVLDKYTLKKIAPVETNECWFELSFYDYGEFELSCIANQKNLNTLKKGRFVKIPNKRFVWVITSVTYIHKSGVRMILAKGYGAKRLLHNRIIQQPVELKGTITSAVYKLVNDNLGAGASAVRQIPNFVVDTNNLLIDITGTQATRNNLGEFTNNLLKTYNCGSIVVYDNGKLKFQILNGEVKTQSVRFSQSFDNLLESQYYTSDEELATNALVVSTVDDIDYSQEYDTDKKGIDRVEILVNSNLSTKYEDANGNELETSPTSDLYKGWQREEGKNELSKHTVIEEVDGELDLDNSRYKFDEDFFIGDIVKVQEEYFGYYFYPRITKYTIKQDTNGYGEEASYGGE